MGARKKNKNPNRIDKEASIELLSKGYRFKVREMKNRNFPSYQFRILHEEAIDTFFDWYHTTGALVKCCARNYHTRMGTFKTAEEVALAINKSVYGTNKSKKD